MYSVIRLAALTCKLYTMHVMDGNGQNWAFGAGLLEVALTTNGGKCQ